MRARPSLLAFVGVSLVVACSSKSAPPMEKDAESDARSTCGASMADDHLSFDVDCTANCKASRHVTFDVAPHRKQAACTDANGHFQLFELTGNDSSTFTLDVAPDYTGKGSYDALGSSGDLVYSGVSATCAEFGTTDLQLALPEATDPKGACSLVVTEDCDSGGARAVTGTFTCELPVADRGASCTLKNGSFSFKSCAI